MCITDSNPSSPFLSETSPSPPSALPSFPAHKVLLCSPGQPGSQLKIFVIFCLHCAGNRDEQLCPVTTFEGFKSQRKLLFWSLATWLAVPHMQQYGSFKVSLVLLYFSSEFSAAHFSPLTLSAPLLCFPLVIGLPANTTPAEKTLPVLYGTKLSS